ncbi:MAG: tRNA pseudouridine(13) synthase TruD [Candidatus Kariarchaeaceae archaeon]|jgi:tRNA pseudouridine13 synthase
MSPSDLDYGISGFNYHGFPIGGRLKREFSDFIVTELDTDGVPIAFPPDPLRKKKSEDGGLFLIGRSWKMGIDHGRMVRKIAKAFGVSEADVSTSGIKDSKAITVQLFSVYQPRKHLSDPFQFDVGLEIDGFYYAREYLWPGSMGGNKFDITVRNTRTINEEHLDPFAKWISQGVLNYYGYQRFGSQRPITAQFGRLIVNRKFEEAIHLYLGSPSSDPKDERIRKVWRDTQDHTILLNSETLPSTERRVLEYLKRKPTDYAGAIKRMPEYLIRIARSAFISLLANHYLSRRQAELPVQKGERQVGANIEIALPSQRWKKPLNELWTEIFKEHSIQIQELQSIRHTSRFLKVFPSHWRAEILSNDQLRVQFHLPNGSYATVVMRELMQEAPDAYY